VSKTESTIDVDRELDADISIRTFELHIARQKEKSWCDVRLVRSGASVGKPTNEGKSQHHANEDFEKSIHQLLASD